MKISEITEEAVSKNQQKFFGLVRSIQKGDTPPKGEAGEVAKDMSKADVKKMASTKHKGLPKKVGENASAEKEDEFHRKLDKLVHKTFGHSSDEEKEVDEAYTQGKAPDAQLKGKEPMPKAKAGRTDHPHGGRLVGETTSAAVATVAGSVGKTIKHSQAYNADGTMKNALDVKETNKRKYGNSVRRR